MFALNFEVEKKLDSNIQKIASNEILLVILVVHVIIMIKFIYYLLK